MQLIILTVIILLICYCLFFRNRKEKNVADFPTVPGRFLFGNIQQFSSTTDIFNICSKYIRTYGSNVKLKAGPYFSVLLSSDPKLIQFILSKSVTLKKSENYLYLKPWLGSGLLISEGLEWKRSRKILTPAFHFEILKNFIGIFDSVGSVFIEKLKKHNNIDSVDLFPIVAKCTLDVICETAMDTKINAQDDQNSEYVNSVRRMSKIIVDRTLSLLKLKNWSFVLTSDYYLQNRLVKLLHKFTSKVIADRKDKLKKKTFSKVNEIKKLSFLDLLLNYRDTDGQALNDKKIREEVDTFMFEGHDTTASAICFTLYCLANHTDIQNQVLKEQKNLFGDEKDPQIFFQDLQNMKYLENVIKESLRLYPPVPIIGRFTTEDISFDNYVIDKNTNIKPEIFDPDRFNSMDNTFHFAFVPFSAGERNCIGQKFALLEMKSIISKVIRHFYLKPAKPKHELVLSMEIVLKSATGIKIGLTERT